MTELSLNPLYIPLIQKPTCCAAACLQMLLYRNGYGLFDQEDLAMKLGVKIGPTNVHAFREDMPRMTQANFDEGLSTINASGTINRFFQEQAIALTVRSYKASVILSLKDFLALHLTANHDLWVEYHAHDIFPNDKSGGKYIHDGLVESYNTATKMLTIIDPVPAHRQRLQLPQEVVRRSISTAYGRETGFLVISSPS